jgi:hypothetical protein
VVFEERASRDARLGLDGIRSSLRGEPENFLKEGGRDPAPSEPRLDIEHVEHRSIDQVTETDRLAASTAMIVRAFARASPHAIISPAPNCDGAQASICSSE